MKKLIQRKEIIIILLVAFIFRILLIPIARHGDINNNTSWGQLFVSRGPVNFYEGKEWPNSAPNQPPLYIAVFGTTAFIQNNTYTLIHWANSHINAFPSKVIWWFDIWGELYIAKLPAIVADLVIACTIYIFFKKQKKLALGLAILWLFNPVSWYNSSIWGGTDSIVNAVGLISVLFLIKKRIVPSAIFFAISVLFKGSLLLFIPLWLLVAVKQKFTSREWVRALMYSVILFVLVTLPFHPNLDMPVWFFNLYTKTFLPGEIGSLTANAFNFWWLIDSGKTLDSTVYLGLTARTWGIVLTVASYGFVMWKNYKKSNVKDVFLSFALVSFISFLFMTRIHERYLYPFFPFATFALATIRWLWIPYILLSLIHLLNLYHLFWAPGIPAIEVWYLNPVFMVVLSLINLLVFGYLASKFVKSEPPIA